MPFESPAGVMNPLIPSWIATGRSPAVEATTGRAKDIASSAVSGRLSFNDGTATMSMAGMVRIGPVYTEPAHRGHGYAAAVTAAAARWALDTGARHVLLFTDAANAVTTEANASFDFRLAPGETPDHVQKLTEAFLTQRGWFIVRGRVKHLAQTHPSPDRRP